MNLPALRKIVTLAGFITFLLYIIILSIFRGHYYYAFRDIAERIVDVRPAFLTAFAWIFVAGTTVTAIAVVSRINKDRVDRLKQMTDFILGFTLGASLSFC